jgi:glycosyltransferase involved in cell wall biosynthesis
VVSRSFAFAVPGDLDTPTGGYAYDRRMIAELERLGWHADVLDLGSEFPRPSAAARSAAQAQLEAVPKGRCIVIDGLALGVLPEAAVALHASHKVVALVHHPLALETGLSPAEADALRESERAALAAVHHVIVTGAATARLLASDYAIAAARISVVPPGVDPVAPGRAGGDGTVALLSVGALVPRKGYDVLLAALATITHLPWRLTIAGARDRSPATAAALDATIATLALADRVTLAGAVADDRLSGLYAEADLFVLASRFEGYGMALAAAIAHGVPVIATRAGAIPETVPAGAGILVAPDDAPALAAALCRVIENAQERHRLAAGARAAAAQLPAWSQSARIFSSVLEAVT